MKSYKYFDTILGIFVATLLISNISSSAKIVDWGISVFALPLTFDAGTLLFPITYIFGDVLTEVYGFAKARRVIWTGFACAALMSGYLFIVQKMPGETQWLQYAGDDAFANILGGVSTGGIILASLCAYLVGEFSNSIVLAKMKVRMNGKYLWVRTIGSTLVGQALDTSVFVGIACAMSVFPWDIAVSLLISNYIFKVVIEILCTPLTYKVIYMLKQAEQEDYYDTTTNFSPLAL